MNTLAPESLSQSPSTLLLPIVDMAQMFNPPPIDPMSPALTEVMGISGVKYVLQQLKTRRYVKLETLRLLLPDGKLTPGVADQTRQALQRYAQHRIQQQTTLLAETRRRGWRVTIAALVLLAGFLALSSFFASEFTEGMRPALLRHTLEYGFEIIGWVMLWHPIEILVFEPIAIKQKIAALRKLKELRVVVEPGGAVFHSSIKFD